MMPSSVLQALVIEVREDADRAPMAAHVAGVLLGLLRAHAQPLRELEGRLVRHLHLCIPNRQDDEVVLGLNRYPLLREQWRAIDDVDHRALVQRHIEGTGRERGRDAIRDGQ